MTKGSIVWKCNALLCIAGLSYKYINWTFNHTMAGMSFLLIEINSQLLKAVNWTTVCISRQLILLGLEFSWESYQILIIVYHAATKITLQACRQLNARPAGSICKCWCSLLKMPMHLQHFSPTFWQFIGRQGAPLSYWGTSITPAICIACADSQG